METSHTPTKKQLSTDPEKLIVGRKNVLDTHLATGLGERRFSDRPASMARGPLLESWITQERGVEPPHVVAKRRIRTCSTGDYTGA